MQHSSLAAALALLLAAPAGAQVTLDGTLNVSLAVGNPGGAGEQVLASFDASASDKLVVVVSSEHAFGTGAGLTIDSVEYAGQAMIEAVQENTLPGTTAIFYLDSPGPAGEVRLFTSNKNGGRMTLFTLSGTVPGVAATAASTTNSVSLTTTTDDTLVIAGILDGGQLPNGNGAGAPTADAPLTEVHSGTWGNSWGGHGCGYQLVATAGAVTPTFTTLGPNLLRTAAAAFEGPSAYLTVDTSGIGLAAGGTANFGLSAGPTFAAMPYLLMGSHSGTTPGLPIDALQTLPLNSDAYWLFTISSPNTPPLADSFGFLDASGAGSASFTVPPGTNPLFAGLDVHHAFVAFDLGSPGAPVGYTSDAVPFQLQP